MAEVIIVSLIILVALFFTIRYIYRIVKASKKNNQGCSGACGCGCDKNSHTCSNYSVKQEE